LLPRSFLCCVPFLRLHASKGCSGFEAWLFNAVFNLALLLLFSSFHRKTYGVADKPAKRAKRA